MWTRALRVVRFRKRYYITDTFDGQCHPEDLGKRIEGEIPTDTVRYQLWLATVRESAEVWEASCENGLSVMPGNPPDIRFKIDLLEFTWQNSSVLLAPLNDPRVAWIYTVDLDRETFSVNNGAHFKLEQVPHIDWINSLADGRLGDTISLPNAVPMEAITSLVAEHTSQRSEFSKIPGALTVGDVSPNPRYWMC